MFGDLVWGAGNTETGLKSDIQTMVKSVAGAGGYLFTQLKKNFADTAEGHSEGYRKETSEGSKMSINQVPGYLTQFKRTLKGSSNTYAEDTTLSS